MLLGKRFSRLQRRMGATIKISLERKSDGASFAMPRKLRALFTFMRLGEERVNKKALLRHTKKFSESLNKKED